MGYNQLKEQLSKEDFTQALLKSDLCICEGQNTASECIVYGIPVLHLPKGSTQLQEVEILKQLSEYYNKTEISNPGLLNNPHLPLENSSNAGELIIELINKIKTNKLKTEC